MQHRKCEKNMVYMIFWPLIQGTSFLNLIPLLNVIMFWRVDLGIASKPILLRKWQPGLKFEKEDLKTIPI